MANQRPNARGQALAEFALITPILLVLMLGGIGFGLLVLQRMQLTHVAQEAAIYGAANDCAGALGTIPQLLGYEPDTKVCELRGRLVEVSLSNSVPLIIPLVPMPSEIRVSARAMLREEPSPSASP